MTGKRKYSVVHNKGLVSTFHKEHLQTRNTNNPRAIQGTGWYTIHRKKKKNWNVQQNTQKAVRPHLKL